MKTFEPWMAKVTAMAPRFSGEAFTVTEPNITRTKTEEDLDLQDYSERLEEALEHAHQELDTLDEVYFSQNESSGMGPMTDEWPEDDWNWQEEEWHGYGVYGEWWPDNDWDESWQEEGESYIQDLADFESNMDMCVAA